MHLFLEYVCKHPVFDLFVTHVPLNCIRAVLYITEALLNVHAIHCVIFMIASVSFLSRVFGI